MPDPTARNQFIYCSNGEGTVGYCPGNQVFNENTINCEVPLRGANSPALSRPPSRPVPTRPPPPARTGAPARPRPPSSSGAQTMARPLVRFEFEPEKVVQQTRPRIPRL